MGADYQKKIPLEQKPQKIPLEQKPQKQLWCRLIGCREHYMYARRSKSEIHGRPWRTNRRELWFMIEQNVHIVYRKERLKGRERILVFPQVWLSWWKKYSPCLAVILFQRNLALKRETWCHLNYFPFLPCSFTSQVGNNWAHFHIGYTNSVLSELLLWWICTQQTRAWRSK